MAGRQSDSRFSPALTADAETFALAHATSQQAGTGIAATAEMEAVGLDEFGREHFVVEAAPGRLCMTLGETEAGFVVVRSHKELTPEILAAWDDADRKRMLLLRETVRIGDRLVAIESEDVVHCSLREVSVRLGKLAAKARQLTFARYHTSHYDSKKYDIEKLVLVHAPRGPLGLLISEVWHHGAVIDGFQPLPDGSMSKLARDSRVHRGCRIINVNGRDVSDDSREHVIEALAALKDQEKELILYRATPAACDKLVQVVHLSLDVPQSIAFDESESCKCVVTSVAGPEMRATLLPGDVLASVNGTDVSWMQRVDALGVLNAATFPRVLHFYRLKDVDYPECHQLRIESGPLGLHLDSTQPNRAVIAGFQSAADAEHPAFQGCASFLPGSHIVWINKLCVVNHTLAEITELLGKLKSAPKDILVANESLVTELAKRQALVHVNVPKGPLGIHFDGARPDEARISGFYAMPDGQQGLIERCGRVAIGSLLSSINGMNVSCLTLTQVTDLLKKLSDVPKDLNFDVRADAARDGSTKVVHVRVPPGPLGIDLKSSISNKVVVDRLNRDPSLGSTFIADHGGVVPGSEVLAIDGYSVASLELSDVTQLLRILVTHEKTITFSTTSAAYVTMMSASRASSLKSAVVTRSPMGITFDASKTQRAVISAYESVTELSEETIPIGSRLVALDHVDLRALDVKQIARVLKDLAGVPKTLVFDTTLATQSAPPSPSRLAQDSNSVTEAMSGPTSPTRVRFDLPDEDEVSSSTRSAPPSLQRRGTTGHATVLPSPPQRNNSMPVVPALASTPPVPPQLAPLSIKPLEVLKSMSLGDSSKTIDQKPQEAASAPSKTEFMINMASSWTGSRSLFRMTVDIPSASLQIVSAKAPTSPRASGKSSGTTVLFSEITSLDFGKKSDAASGTSASVAIGVAKSKKPLELDMRSRDERQELCALLSALVPALAT